MKNANLVAILIFLVLSWLAAQGAGIQAEAIQPQVLRQMSSEKHEFLLVRVLGGIDQPWSLAFLPDGSMLISERPGRLLLFKEGRGSYVRGLPAVSPLGQGGLLDLAIAPDFRSSGTIYFTYASGSQGRYGTSLGSARLRYGSGEPYLEDVKVLWQTAVENRSSGGQHFGSRVLLLSDGSLLLTHGDRGSMARAQNPADPAGSTIRVLPDGSIPPDNPFINREVVNARNEIGRPLPEVYTFGHRNPQGLAMDPEGRVWAHEHGPRGGDEINLILAGRNYGWPVTTHGIDYSGAIISNRESMPGVEDPRLVWVPSIAPSGFTFYQGNAFPNWKTSAFVGALAGQHLRRVEFSGERVVAQEIMFQNELGRIRDVRTGPDGFLYILGDGPNASLYRLEPLP